MLILFETVVRLLRLPPYPYVLSGRAAAFVPFSSQQALEIDFLKGCLQWASKSQRKLQARDWKAAVSKQIEAKSDRTQRDRLLAVLGIQIDAQIGGRLRIKRPRGIF